MNTTDSPVIEIDVLTDDQISRCSELIKAQRWDDLFDLIDDMAYADVAEALEESDYLIPAMHALLKKDEKKTGRVCSYLSEAAQLDIFEDFSDTDFARIFINMEPDIRVDLFQAIPEDDRKKFLRLLDHKTVGNLFLLDSYDPDTAGGIMSTEYLAFNIHQTVLDVVKILKTNPSRAKDSYNIYITDDERVLKGQLTIRDMLFAERDNTMEEILKDIVTAAHVDEDQESVAKRFEKYDVYNIPVVNDSNQLVGQISSDDIIDVIREEETEDYEKLMGISQTEHEVPYLESTLWEQYKKRVIWLVGLTLVGFVAGMVVRHFDATLEEYVILAIFMPLIASTGGNVGSQASSVIIRALALDEIEAHDWISVILREVRVAILIAITLGLLAFGGVFFLSYGMDLPADTHLLEIAETIGIALSLQVLSAIVFGTGIPLLVKMFNGDPALVASPAITTFVDITGLLIYFSVATMLLIN